MGITEGARRGFRQCITVSPCGSCTWRALRTSFSAQPVSWCPILIPSPTFEEGDQGEWARKSPSPTFEEEDKDAEDPESEGGKKNPRVKIQKQVLEVQNALSTQRPRWSSGEGSIL